MSEAKRADDGRPDPARTNGWAGTVRFILLLALAAWALRSLVVAPFSIPTGSMMPALLPGDYLFVSKWPYGYSRYSFPAAIPSFEGRIFERLPERGDVVIFKRPDIGNEDWVKRVIGLPGDRVEVRGGHLIINGKAVRQEPRGLATLPASANIECPASNSGIDADRNCRYPAILETLPNGRRYMTFDQNPASPGDNFGPAIVPEDHLFLLGDNRDDSSDSRFTLEQGGIGMVPVDRLVGRAAFAFWSTDGTADYARPWTWFSALRADRIGMGFQP